MTKKPTDRERIVKLKMEMDHDWSFVDPRWKTNFMKRVNRIAKRTYRTTGDQLIVLALDIIGNKTNRRITWKQETTQ